MWLCNAKKFKKAQNAGLVNRDSDILSWVELNMKEKSFLKIREDKQTTPNEETRLSSDVVGDDQFYFSQADSKNKPEEQNKEETPASFVRMSNRRGTSLTENQQKKIQIVQIGRRKLYVVFHDRKKQTHEHD